MIKETLPAAGEKEKRQFGKNQPPSARHHPEICPGTMSRWDPAQEI